MIILITLRDFAILGYFQSFAPLIIVSEWCGCHANLSRTNNATAYATAGSCLAVTGYVEAVLILGATRGLQQLEGDFGVR